MVAEMSQATRDSNGKLSLFLQRLYHLVCTSKSSSNVPDSQFTNQVPAKSQTTVAVHGSYSTKSFIVLVL